MRRRELLNDASHGVTLQAEQLVLPASAWSRYALSIHHDSTRIQAPIYVSSQAASSHKYVVTCVWCLVHSCVRERDLSRYRLLTGGRISAEGRGPLPFDALGRR